MHEHNNYNIFQVSFPLPNEKIFSDNEPVVKFLRLMESVDLSKYLNKYNFKDSRGRKKLNRRNILLVILFAFSINIRSTRDIFEACKYDTRFIFLLNGIEIKSHNTICNIINEINDVDKLLSDINNQIFKDIDVDTDTVYIDGTKIEAYANKYSFVWKNTVIKNKNKLIEKIKKLIPSINIIYKDYNIKPLELQDSYNYVDLINILQNLQELILNNNIELVSGKGKRKNKIQKIFNLVEQLSSKYNEYNNHLLIIGENRNSYSKTDNDATFMRMKEDYMKNGQLKPAYNYQVAVSNGFALAIGVYQDRADYNTFKPLMNKIKSNYGKYPKYPVADAGYGNYENYKFCEMNHLELYLKYSYYSYEKTSKYKNNKYNKNNFQRDKKGNILCPKGYKFEYEKDKKEYNFEGAELSKIYRCKKCKRCKERKYCTKSQEGRTIIINEDYNRLKNKAKNNLDSELGIKLRVNRSIQVEGFFAILKEDSKYKKLNRRTKCKVELELTLIAIGQNIKRYCQWNKIQYEIKKTEKK